MEELIKLVSQKTGLPQEQAKVAVQTVIGFLKQRLPKPIADQIDGALSGGTSPQDLLKGLGDLLGKK